MSAKYDVRPITDLKNHAADLIREVADDGRTVVITQNGRAKAVVVEIGAYDRLQNALALLKILAQAEADVNAGRTVSTRQAFKRANLAITRDPG